MTIPKNVEMIGMLWAALGRNSLFGLPSQQIITLFASPAPSQGMAVSSLSEM